MDKKSDYTGGIRHKAFRTYRFFFIPALLFFAMGSAFAQEDFRNGFIISRENDTIQGQVLYRSGNRRYESCIFKIGQGEKTYKPDQILGYGFADDKYYASGVVEGSFVETLVEGKLSLYRSRGQYHIRKDTAVYLLVSKKELVNKDGKVGLTEKGNWQGIVNYLTGDCLEASEIGLNSLRLSDNSLVRLVVTYNECVNAEYKEFRSNRPWLHVDVGLILGVNRNQLRPLDYSSSNIYSYLDDGYTSYDPTLGVLFEVSSPRITGRAAFQLEFHYWESGYASFASIPGTPNRNFDVFINLNTLSIPMSFKYKFRGKRLTPFVQLGFNIDQHLESSARLLSEEVRPGEVITNPEGEAFLIKNNQFGYWAGAGFLKSFSKFQAGIGIRAYIMSPLDKSGMLEVKTNRIALNVILQTR